MINVFKVFPFLIVLLIALAGPATAAPPPQKPSDQQLIDQLKQDTQNKVRISYHPDTGKVSFIGTEPVHTIPRPSFVPVKATPEEAARGFLVKYGQLFGLRDAAGELSLMEEQPLKEGRVFVRFQQRYHNIPIVAGELIVQMNDNRDFISANGEILPELDLDTNPAIPPETARQIALGKVAKDYNLNPGDLTATDPELWIYNPLLLRNATLRPSMLVWRLEVTPQELLPIREFVLVDAKLGFIALQFNQIDSARNRRVYDNNNNPSLGLPGGGPYRTEGQAPSSITDVNQAYNYSGNTYDFYFNEHGRDSLNNAGMTLISTTRYCPNSSSCPYPNAFWNGTQMAYGQGFAAADDVVGHELTHGVTEFSSHLFYYYQSGAINESFSDVWGEFIDLTNGAGTDTAAVRWLMGEDIPGIGAIRDMENPPTFGDPDRMLSANYYCEEGDSGGVHFNSGVNNKAAFLMTDGGSFNGYTVSALGISKVADLYYEVQTHLLTSGSSYNDLYNALVQAGLNLGYSAADRQEIQDALNAVQMNQRPCGDSAPPPICATGQSVNHIFFDNMESPASGRWASAAIVGTNEWYYPQTANPYGFDATYASSGVYNLWGYDRPATGDYYIAMTSGVTLPANAFLHFKHDWAFEDGTSAIYDGGVMEYSTNNGASWNDAGALFTHNGYNGVIGASSNPLNGRSAFTHESHGYTASRLNLNSLAGQNVRFRFRIGTDSTADALGWFIDDVRIYTCGSTTLPTPPGNLTASPASQTQINLAWTDNSNNETGFKIERSPNGTSGWTQITTVGTNITTYNNTGLTCNTRYYYRVRAYNGSGDSTYSNTANATTLVCGGGSNWKVLFDETHGYGSDLDDYIIEDALSNLAALLINNGATVNSLKPPAAFNYAAISQYNVLVLVVPQSSYSAQQRADINTFVQNGGRLVTVGDWGGWGPADTARPILNTILSGLGTGIAINDNMVLDPTNHDGANNFWPIIHQFSSKPINQGVNQVVEYAAASLQVGSPGYVTAWADNDSYTGLTDLSTIERDAAGLLASPPNLAEGQFIIDGLLSNTPPPPKTELNEPQAQPDVIVPQAVTVINFDNASQPCLFNQTTALRNQYQALGVTFSGPSSNDGGAILDQCGGFGVSGHSAPNFLAFNASATLSNGGVPRNPETITFAQPVSFAQIRVGSSAGSGQSLTMQAFNASNNLLGSQTVTLNATLQTLSISANGITRVVISSPASIFVLDDLTFNTQTAGQPLPVMAMADIGNGDVFVIADLSLWTNQDPDGDGTASLNEYNNTTLALKVFLGAAGGGPGAENKTYLPVILRNH
ncbi:MAG: hypothetical protein Fur0044_20000 [Anaerolineae bacterium]